MENKFALHITPNPITTVFKPLDEITVGGFTHGTVRVLDGNGASFDIALLLPENASVKSVTVNGAACDFTVRKIENSAYCHFAPGGLGVKEIVAFVTTIPQTV